jgi:hypothetical protein
MPHICDMRQRALLPLRRKACWGFFRPKNPTALAGFEPTILGTRGQQTWKAVGRVVDGCCQAQCAWQRPPTTRPTTFHVWKTRGSQCSFRLLMMGSVPPKTCWASYKYGILKLLIHCCILLDVSLWIVVWCTDARTWRHRTTAHNDSKMCSVVNWLSAV